MNIFGCIQVVFGLLAVGYGVMVMRGVLKVTLGCKQARRFLKYGLIASLAGLLPLSHRLSLSSFLRASSSPLPAYGALFSLFLYQLFSI